MPLPDPASAVSWRTKAAAKLHRLIRWEFWPRSVFYTPMIPWWIWLAIRHRSATIFTAANPGLPHGGMVGESKHDTLRHVPADLVVPTVLLPPGPAEDRAAALTEAMRSRQWSFPIILKPDVGERGTGVRLIRDADRALDYLRLHTAALVAQTFHPGPFEAGVFYVRIPGEAQGRIFSITDKHFPIIIGDGVRSLRELIWNHPRYRLQADRFLERFGPAADRIPADHERVPLAVAGNHCQGTLFADGAHLITAALNESIDRAAKAIPGFFFGRFDVRYSSPEGFKIGVDLAIVEVNGVLSESTNIYDPRSSLLNAYITLARQWSLAFRIGAANKRLGHAPSTPAQILGNLRTHHQRDARDLIAD